MILSRVASAEQRPLKRIPVRKSPMEIDTREECSLAGSGLRALRCIACPPLRSFNRTEYFPSGRRFIRPGLRDVRRLNLWLTASGHSACRKCTTLVHDPRPIAVLPSDVHQVTFVRSYVGDLNMINHEARITVDDGYSVADMSWVMGNKQLIIIRRPCLPTNFRLDGTICFNSPPWRG